MRFLLSLFLIYLMKINLADLIGLLCEGSLDKRASPVITLFRGKWQAASQDFLGVDSPVEIRGMLTWCVVVRMRTLFLMVSSYWQWQRPRQLKNGLYRIVWSCSHCTETRQQRFPFGSYLSCLTCPWSRSRPLLVWWNYNIHCTFHVRSSIFKNKSYTFQFCRKETWWWQEG